MDGVNLSPADKAAIERKLNLMEIEDASMYVLRKYALTSRTANEIVQSCFKSCVKSNRTKNLDAGERDCITRCTEKFIESSNRIAARFQELQDITVPQE